MLHVLNTERGPLKLQSGATLSKSHCCYVPIFTYIRLDISFNVGFAAIAASEITECVCVY